MPCTFWTIGMNSAQCRKRWNYIKTLWKRHKNELLGSPVRAHTSQTEYIDFRTTGYWHQPALRPSPHTTWSTWHSKHRQCLSRLCSTHTHHRVSRILYFHYICFLYMSCCFGLNLILNQTPNLSNYSKYAAVTLTMSMSTDMIEPLL